MTHIAHRRTLSFKTSEILNDLLARIRSIAFDRKAGDELIRAGDLVLAYPDSFHATPPEELRR